MRDDESTSGSCQNGETKEDLLNRSQGEELEATQIFINLDRNEPSASPRDSSQDEEPEATQIFINSDRNEPSVSPSDSGTLQDLLDIMSHKSEDEPAVAPTNYLEETDQVTLPEDTIVVKHPDDGSCLFHAMAYLLKRLLTLDLAGGQLRTQIADFIDQNEQTVMDGKIRQWK